jgi:hypothetical protein
VRIVGAEIKPAANVILTAGADSWKSDRSLFHVHDAGRMLL